MNLSIGVGAVYAGGGVLYADQVIVHVESGSDGRGVERVVYQ